MGELSPLCSYIVKTMKQLPNWKSMLAIALACATFPSAHAAGNASVAENELRRLEKEQEALLRDAKARLLMMDESPRKAELRATIAEVESRLSGPQDLYVSPGTKFTPAMTNYYERMQRRIEDCGTRHFPMRDGRKLHGTAFVSITLDRAGRMIKTDILKSSGEQLIDRHVSKLVAASAPFGELPEEVELDRSAPYRNLVVATKFSFIQDGKPIPEDLPQRDRCKWK